MFNPHKLAPNIQHSTKLKNKYFVVLFYPRGDLLSSADIENHYNGQRDNRQIFGLCWKEDIPFSSHCFSALQMLQLLSQASSAQ